MGSSLANAPEIQARALWYAAPGECVLRPEKVARPAEEELLVEARYSGISRGTESLVHGGRVPESEWQRMRAPFQAGEFPFPVKYGYASVGRVLAGDPKLIGRTVFSLFPHQSAYSIPSQSCIPIPEQISAERCVLAANMETALNALWDGKPSPGDQISVVGGGVIGLLTAYLCRKIPGTRVTLVDVNPERARISANFGLEFSCPETSPGNQDLVFHASASPQGLATALRCAGNDAAVIEMSWYGANSIEVPLGMDFHSRRLKLVSSQVGTIPPERQGRWTFRRRLETAISLLDDPVLDQLISERVPFDKAPERLPELLNKTSDVLAAVIVYDNG